MPEENRRALNSVQFEGLRDPGRGKRRQINYRQISFTSRLAALKILSECLRDHWKDLDLRVTPEVLAFFEQIAKLS
jgi:hypothetical protein